MSISPAIKAIGIVGGIAVLAGIALMLYGARGLGTAIIVAAIADLAFAAIFLVAKSALHRKKNRPGP